MDSDIHISKVEMDLAAWCETEQLDNNRWLNKASKTVRG